MASLIQFRLPTLVLFEDVGDVKVSIRCPLDRLFVLSNSSHLFSDITVVNVWRNAQILETLHHLCIFDIDSFRLLFLIDEVKRAFLFKRP